MDRNQQPHSNPRSPEKQDDPADRSNDPKLGRERPGEGLDTGIDTGAIEPGKTGGARPLN